MSKNLRSILLAVGVALLMSTVGILMAQPPDDAPPPPADQTQAAPANPSAQPNANPPNDQAGRGRGMRMDPERMLNMIKERIGATDEEWTAMKPQIEAINKVRTKTMMGMMGAMRGGRRGGQGGPGGQGGQFATRMAEINPEAAALSTAVESETTPKAELQAKLKAYRDAAKKDAEALKTARENLRKLVTVRQEAMLVVAGILD